VPETETIYLKVRKKVKERLERLARERGAYLVDVASDALERGLGLLPTTPAEGRTAGPSLVEVLIGAWRLKNCRHLNGDGYCAAWTMPRDEALRIYGDYADAILEPRTVRKPVFLGPIQTGVEEVEAYSLKPSPAVCFHCPFFERR